MADISAHRPTMWRRWSIAFLALGVLVLAAFFGVRWWQNRQTARLERLVALKDQAVALAENLKYVEANELLQQLAEELPDEPLVQRNLAVVRVGQVKRQLSGDENDDTSIPLEKVVEAVQTLLKAEPNEAASHILAARASQELTRLFAPDLAAQLPDPLESLQAASRLAPKDAAVRYEIYELLIAPPYNARPDARAVQSKALREAHQLEPRNIAILLTLLKHQSGTRSPDTELVETLDAARAVLLPLREIVSRLEGGANLDVAKSLDQAHQAAEAKEWGKARVAISALDNIVKTSWPQKTDRMRINVGALEYLRYDFLGPIAQQIPDKTLKSAAETNVVFVPVRKPLPQLEDVRDVRLADVDLNGRLDIVVLHATRLSVFTQPRQGDGWSKLLETDVPRDMHRLLVADLDRDAAALPAGLTPKIRRLDGDKVPGDDSVTEEFVELDFCNQAFPDFLLYGPGGICAVRNEMAGETATASETGGLTRKLTLPAIPKELAEIGEVTAAILVDFDHDQDLDVVVGTEGQGVRLWRMLGNGTFKFEDYSQWSALPPARGTITDLALVDWDRDLYTDLFVAYGADEDGEPPLPVLLHNQRHGQFVAKELGPEYQALRGSSNLVPLELDGNVSWDLVGVSTAGISGVLTTTPEPGKVNVLKQLPRARGSGQRLLTWDFDNDTFPDLLAWDANSFSILRGTTYGWVPLDENRLKLDIRAGLRSVDYGDVDGDGDLDLLLAHDDRMELLDNQGGNAHAWLHFFVTGKFDGKQDVGANNSAIGTTVEVQTAGRYQAQVITRQPVHVGLGKATEADRIRLLFTNGIPRSARFAKVNRFFCEEQVLGGSCPFIYCFDGEKYEFFSDCLWAAPIGLQVAEGKMAPSRAWEYLLIPGERLKERSGTYDLQITEELWEAAYFDEVKLIAVDHPADTDLYTNEKVGGPDVAAPKLHLVRQPRRPVAARDKHGRDVLATISRRDDHYLRGFDQHVKQGLVDEHFLELDLGQFDVAPKTITLFLTGWIYPTNTSINVNLSQHPDLEYPRLPYVQVADGQGGWKEVQAFMGFPGGKTKTIAVEMSGDDFAAGEHKLRIGTSAEIYWDDVFFTIDEEPIVGAAPHQILEQPLELVSADLHFRGWSAELPHPPHAPLRFDYQSVSTEPKWPPMGGHFTRFGDVAPLLASADDEMVVMGSGDEMTVRFRVPAKEPPAGWKRDFILYSVGWDKDADLNTIYGQTAEPLPYNAMPSYPYAADQWYPDTPRTRRYLETYQTRDQDHQRFWRYLAH